MNPIPREWVDPSPLVFPPDLLKEAGGDLFLAGVLARRGILKPEEARVFLNPALYSPAAPSDIPDLSLAADRIEEAIHKGERIGVWGDFDADGQTATTVMVSGLMRLGAVVTHHIPVRAAESHGVNILALKQMMESGVRLVVTCDTGITAHEAVNWASQQGIDMIITDHHSLPAELPRALANVNPQRLPSIHPLFPLCGVGCAYKLMEELHRRANRLEELEEDLDLVMLGTVADLALLQGENRYWVWKGLQMIRRSRRPAIEAILETAGARAEDLTEEQVGFILAPRLNALGRLSDANPVVGFFLSKDAEMTRVFSTNLEGLNARRKLLSDQVFRGAIAQIENNRKLLDQPALILDHPEWPGGVIGIAASRLVEQFHRPVILISSPPGETARGSARSVEGLNITQAIAASAAILQSYGGHPMAAGLAILPEKIPEFRQQLVATVNSKIAEDPLKSQVMIDAAIPFSHLTDPFIRVIDSLSPFGPGNSPVILAARNVQVVGVQVIGKGQEHRRLLIEDENGHQQDVLRWNAAGLDLPTGRFELAYTVRTVNYRGQNSLQLTWIDARALEEPAIVAPVPLKEWSGVDLRQIQDVDEALRRVEGFEDVLIWREGEPSEDFPGVSRSNICPCTTLALWNSPPGINELKTIILTASPRQIIFLNLNSPEDQAAPFLKRLAGLVKHILAVHLGVAPLVDLAGATNQKETTVLSGLKWLAARGEIDFSLEDGMIQITRPGSPDPSRLDGLEKELVKKLKETHAFREYYQRVTLDALLKSVQ